MEGSGRIIGFGTDRKRLEKQWDYGSRVLEEFLGVSSRPGERSNLSLSRVFASVSVFLSLPANVELEVAARASVSDEKERRHTCGGLRRKEFFHVYVSYHFMQYF